jgi:thiazole/oxazole-forming peptide maturase SagD family component
MPVQDAPGLTFGAPFAGEGNRPFRERLAVLLGARTVRPVHVDTVLGVSSRARRNEFSPGPPMSYLLFDFQRMVLYEEPDNPEEARIESVVLWLVDAYPHQPIDHFVVHDEAEPYRFLYAIEVLEVLRTLWSRRRGDTVTVCDLVSGEIVSALVRVHPEAVSPPPAQLRGADGFLPAPPLQLHTRWTDATLRAGRKPAPTGQVSPAVGVARELYETRDAADLPLVCAQLAWNGGRVVQPVFGKSFRPDVAVAVAEYEADERCGAIFRRPDEALVYGSFQDLGDVAVDPRLLFYDTPVSTEGGPPLSDTERLSWTWATDPLQGRSVLVPAQEVWFRARAAGERSFVRSTTNACALGSSVEEAAMFAVFEAIERDAFLTAWYTRRPCDLIDPESVEHEDFQLLRRRFALAFPDYRFHLFDATTDVGISAVIGVAVRHRGTGPRSFSAAAARLSPARACFAALGDLAGFSPRMDAESRDARRILLNEPDRVRGPEGHYHLYTLDETFERLGFLDFSSPPRTSVGDMENRQLIPACYRYDLRALLDTIAARLRFIGASVLLKDITHRWVADRGLWCVRAVTPGLYPLWFGPRDKRFGVTERLTRLGYQWTGRTLSAREDFNLELHPLS